MKDWQDIAPFVACAVAMILLPGAICFLAVIGAVRLLPADFPMGWAVSGLSAVFVVGGYAYFNSGAYRRREERRLKRKAHELRVSGYQVKEPHS